MTSKSLSSIADDYFYNINPLAQRIGEDVKATKEAYEGLWNTLSPAEKSQAIDETIIQPEVALKYTRKNVQPSKDMPEWYPRLRIQTGLKYIIDETGSTLRWRDEHSGPFSFMTQSQMNLSLSDGLGGTGEKTNMNGCLAESDRYVTPTTEISSVESSLDEYSSPSDRLNFYQSDSYSDSVFNNTQTSNVRGDGLGNESSGNIFAKLMNKTSLLKMTGNGRNVSEDCEGCDDDTEILVSHKTISIRQFQKGANSKRNEMNINLSDSRPKSGDINESTALLETPSSYSSFQSSHTNQEDFIPKTGFEFLDNW